MVVLFDSYIIVFTFGVISSRIAAAVWVSSLQSVTIAQAFWWGGGGGGGGGWRRRTEKPAVVTIFMGGQIRKLMKIIWHNI